MLKNDTPISYDELNSLVSAHEENVKTEELKNLNWVGLDLLEAGRRRKSISAIGEGILNDADLRGVDLRRRILVGANIQRSNLDDALLRRSDFTGAFLYAVSLKDVKANRITLHAATLERVDLSRADLSEANLQSANFSLGSLAGANLTDSDLLGARFTGTDLSGVIYEPNIAGLPNAKGLSKALNLHLMTYDNDRSGLVNLKNGFQVLGFRDQERDVTYALKKRDRERLTQSGERLRRIEGRFLFMLFEWTCHYGRKPGFPLLLMIILLGICYFFYLFTLMLGGKGSIWKLVPKEQQLPIDGNQQPTMIEFSRCNFLEVIWYPLYLSLLSAFRIGWREFHVGTWLSRSLPIEYTLVMRGWVKLIAGTQSIASVYLFALSILTYFGRPFE